jgi:hypothetical protein
VAEISGEAQHLYAPVAAAPFSEKFEGTVSAAVVHEDNFTGIRRLVDEARYFGGKQREALLLVVAGTDERE